MSKRLFVRAFCPALFFISSYAQVGEEGWVWRYPVPQANTLRAGRIFQTTGIAIGDYGAIIRTSDKGLTWSSIPNAIVQQLQGLARLSEGRWIAVGREGTILASEDDGLTWNRCPTDGRADLFAVEFVTAKRGAAVGASGTILWSEDGGLSWMPKNSGSNADLRALAFSTPGTVIVVGKGGTILKTKDSGKTWISDKAAMDLFAVRFTDERNGWAVGGKIGYLKNRQIIIRTTDGGDTWQVERKKLGPVLYGLSVEGPQDLMACGDKGTLLRSTDGGGQWTSLKSSTKHVLSALARSGEIGMAVGSYGTIVAASDGGKTWTLPSPEKERSLETISFANAELGMAAGREESTSWLLWTQDGGRTWTRPKSNPARYFWGSCFVNARMAFVLGSEGTVYRSSDAGVTWDQAKTGVDLYLSKLAFADERTGIAVGYSAIVATEDGGKTWTRRAIPPKVGDFVSSDVACADKNRWLVVGYTGVIMASEDGGRTWRSEPSGTSLTLRAVAWSDPRTATIVGNRGLILQRLGGGWETRKSGTKYDLNAVQYLNASVGFAVGDLGTIVRTEDGGRTWALESSPTLNHLRGLARAGNLLTAVGSFGTILQREVRNPVEEGK